MMMRPASLEAQSAVAYSVRGYSMGAVRNGWWAFTHGLKGKPNDDLMDELGIAHTRHGRTLLRFIRKGRSRERGTWSRSPATPFLIRNSNGPSVSSGLNSTGSPTPKSTHYRRWRASLSLSLSLGIHLAPRPNSNSRHQCESDGDNRKNHGCGDTNTGAHKGCDSAYNPCLAFLPTCLDLLPQVGVSRITADEFSDFGLHRKPVVTFRRVDDAIWRIVCWPYASKECVGYILEFDASIYHGLYLACMIGRKGL